MFYPAYVRTHILCSILYLSISYTYIPRYLSCAYASSFGSARYVRPMVFLIYPLCSIARSVPLRLLETDFFMNVLLDEHICAIAVFFFYLVIWKPRY